MNQCIMVFEPLTCSLHAIVNLELLESLVSVTELNSAELQR
jgi:hypothetical protein